MIAILMLSPVIAVVDATWRAICHHHTYMPSAVGSRWLTELSVEGGRLWYSPRASVALADLDFGTAAMIKQVGG